MESSEHGAHISPTNLYKQADYWQVYIFILLFWDLPKILVLATLSLLFSIVKCPFNIMYS